MESLLQLGTMTVFYIPSHKLDDPRYSEEQTARLEIHHFLMKHFQAYTHTPTTAKGYWTDEIGRFVHDVMERFEVSFNSESEFERLIEFLLHMGEELQEASIYLTRGDRSYLVLCSGTSGPQP